MKQEKIDRINTLYHKSQAVGLTEEEKEIFKKELIEFMEERKKVFEDNKNGI